MDLKSKEILKDYESSLEDLTFNSKPIINMLTMLANRHRALASEIVDLVETRFFKVRAEYKLPTLYLMDSMIKNLGGEYLQLITKNIVGMFCKAFESLTDPKIRVSLYKLRQTWAAYVAIKKLAAIDKHIHAIDPNWPITAREDPPSPTIFVNPKFLESNEKDDTEKVEKEDNKNIKRSRSPVPSYSSSTRDPRKSPLPQNKTLLKSPKRSQSPKNRSRSPIAFTKEPKITIQDKRQQLKQQLRQKKMDKKRAMGLLPPDQPKQQRSLSPSPPKKSYTRLNLPEKQRPRSASPTVPMATEDDSKSVAKDMEVEKKLVGNKHTKELEPHEQPTNKKPCLDDQLTSSESQNEIVPPKSPVFKPLHPDVLDLEDLPTELLSEHQAYIMKQAKHQLQSGKLSSDQHSALLKQVDQLYELQKQRNQQKQDTQNPPVDNHKNIHKETIKNSSHPPPPPFSHPSDHSFRSVSHSRPLLPPPSHNHMYHPNFDDKFPPLRGPRHPISNRGNYRQPPPSHRGGPPRRPSRRGRDFPPYDNRPPFKDYPPRHNPQDYSPPRHSGPPRAVIQPDKPQQSVAPPMNINALYDQLVESGLLANAVGNPPDQPTVKKRIIVIHDIDLTMGSIRKRYDNVVDLLLRGESCTSCGLRFTDEQKEAYQKHLDWHYTENRMDKEGTSKTSRNWYIHHEDWLTLEGSLLESQDNLRLTVEVEQTDEPIRKEEESVVSCNVLPGEDSEVCAVCHEPFEQFWEEDEEEWHFREAIRAPDNQLFHSYCYQDYNELNSSISTPVEGTKPILN